MNYIKCPKCGKEEPAFDYAHVCGPIEVKRPVMNERIKELMGKTLDSEFSHTWDTMTYEGLLQFSEKFAELIVKECVDTVSDCSVEYCTRPQIVSEIKLHFGVEQ